MTTKMEKKMIGQFYALTEENGKLKARITELESQILHQTEISACRIEERERLQKQIAALQEIAVGGVAWKLMAEHNEFSSRVKDLVDFLDDARRQLSEEHPEAFR